MFCILMATHFRFHPSEAKDHVPINATYSYPSQAALSKKRVFKIPPLNGNEFRPGQIIKLQFPSEGYLDTPNTSLAFDVDMIYNNTDGDFSYVRFQNNIQSIFKRVRLMYGSTPIEDIPEYNVIVRALSEWTSNSKTFDQTSINLGYGGVTHVGTITNPESGEKKGGAVSRSCHVRQNYIQGKDFTCQDPVITTGTVTDYGNNYGAGTVPNAAIGSQQEVDLLSGMNNKLHPNYAKGSPHRRYQVHLMLGMFQQQKLIPLKFMASQLHVEIELENPRSCMYYRPSVTWSSQPAGVSGVGTPGATPTYVLKNVCFNAQTFEYGSLYDAQVIKQIVDTGIPIKFDTWHSYKFSSSGAPYVSLQIPERSKSVKSIYVLQRREPETFDTDSGACFFDTTTGEIDGASTLQEFQFKIGGKYYPEEPIKCSTLVGGIVPNSGCEAFVELKKCLNIIGNYLISTENNTLSWALTAGNNDHQLGLAHNILPEYDYDHEVLRFKPTGAPVLNIKKHPGEDGNSGGPITGSVASAMFAMSVNLETTKGLDISGLDALNATTIELIARYSKPQQSGFAFNVFTYIDSLFVLKDNNEVQITQ
jgi:hypothetical protein